MLSRLEKWHLAVAADQRETRVPFQSSKDEKKCVFIFTDTDYARQFAKENELNDVSGESVLVWMTPSNAVKWSEEQSTANGLEIVYLNFGPDGCFSGAGDLPRIFRHMTGVRN